MLPQSVGFHDSGINRVAWRDRDLVLTLDAVATEVADANAAGPGGFQFNSGWFALLEGMLIFRNARAVIINDISCDEVARENCSGEILRLSHESDGRMRLESLWGREFELWLIDCDDVEWVPAQT